MWQSDYAEDNPVVEYRKTGDDDTIMALPASSDAFNDDGVTTYIHTATVTDLAPGTAYEYRVGYGDKRSSWTSFHTAERQQLQVPHLPRFPIQRLQRLVFYGSSRLAAQSGCPVLHQHG